MAKSDFDTHNKMAKLEVCWHSDINNIAYNYLGIGMLSLSLAGRKYLHSPLLMPVAKLSSVK